MVSRLSFDCIGQKRLPFYDSLFFYSNTLYLSLAINGPGPDNSFYKFLFALLYFNEV